MPGQILSQDPASGTHLKEGGVLALTVSLGPPLVPLPPDLVGKPLADVTAELAAAGFSVGEVAKQFDEEAAADVVLALGPDLLPQMPKGSAVPLVVSAGPAPRTIPDLSGLTVDQARQKLEALQLNVATRNQPTEDAPEGSLMDSDPRQGSAGCEGVDGNPGRGRSGHREGSRREGPHGGRRRPGAAVRRASGERHPGFAGQSRHGHQPGSEHDGEARPLVAIITS